MRNGARARDRKPVFPKAGDVKLDGPFDQPLHFLNRSPHDAYAWEIGNVSAERRRPVLDDDKVLHPPILARIIHERCAFAHDAPVAGCLRPPRASTPRSRGAQG